jgi:hypothetical protein
MRKKYPDKTTGKLKERRYGLRIDDDIEVYIVAGDMLRVVKGRVLNFKDGIQLIDEDGYYHKVSYDWITDYKVIKHNRPHPIDDPEYKKAPKKSKTTQKPKFDTAYG